MTRVLILYIVRNSGHHTSARYLENAFHNAGPDIETRCVDLLVHLHPKLGKLIERMYMVTIRRTPELWEALYDNFWVELLTRRLRQLIQKGKNASIKRLMAEFNPDAVVCTQAFPFAVIDSFINHKDVHFPLIGITTDFVPHRFWVVNNGSSAQYVVPMDSAAERLMWLGIDEHRICIFGIPVGAGAPDNANTSRPPRRNSRILVMGGGRGMGIRYRTTRQLDRCPNDFTIDVVCGTNRRLRKRLVRHRHTFKHPIRIRGYVHNAVELMYRSDLIITKPGGVTLAEALCAGVPLLLVRPLPGQEKGNAQVLVHHGAALHVRNDYDVTRSITTLLNNPNLLMIMRSKAQTLACPNAGEQIVRHVLNLVAERKST